MWKVNFGVMHATHITVEEQCLAQRFCKMSAKSYILTVKNNDK